MYCGNCGKELKENSKFCSTCGTPVKVQSVVKTEAVPAVEKKNSSKTWLAVLIIVLALIVVIAAVGIGAYLLSNYYFDNTSNVTTSEKSLEYIEADDEDEEDFKEKDTDKKVEEETSETDDSDDIKCSEYMKRASEIETYDREVSKTAMDQTSMNQSSYEVYMMWDTLLNDVYQYLKATLPSDKYKALQSDEIEWIQEKEAAMESAASVYEGGTMAPLVRNSTGSDYTRERCYYLISLID